MNIFYYLLITVFLFFLFFWYFSERQKRIEKINERLFQKIDDLFLPQISQLRQELDRRLKENKENLDRTTKMFVSNISQFSANISKITNHLDQLENSMSEISSFQEVFKTPKLRGRWGEISLENLLSQFLSTSQYKTQYTFKSGETVDAIVKLPNDRILSIDAKFPYDFFERMKNEKDKVKKEQFRKNFLLTVKKEIDDIAKKYILPQEGTLNFALMYIPAEAVYYEILHNFKEENLEEYARKKKVILVSPNMFFAFLKIIIIANRDSQISKQIHNISKRLSLLISDAKKLAESFNKLDKHLANSRSAFEVSQRRLNLFLERSEKLLIDNIEEVPKLEKKEEKNQEK